jgi:predicted Zn-dependent protease
MRGVDRPLELFRALNDLNSGDALRAGAEVKIVAE